jgi:hypothetical protein
MQESPYYAYRAHFTTPTVTVGSKPEEGNSSGGIVPADAANMAPRTGTLTRPGEEARGIPQPTPARTNDPRFKLLEINPAEYMKYRSERPEGSAPASHQMVPSSGPGITTPSGPGPAPGGMEEGVSGLLWVILSITNNWPIHYVRCLSADSFVGRPMFTVDVVAHGTGP